MTSQPDPARNRFLTISLIRLSGAVMAAFGLVVIAGALPSIPIAAGYISLIVGVVDFLVIPRWLVSIWKTPDA